MVGELGYVDWYGLIPVQNGKRIMHSPRAMFKRSDGWKLHSWEGEKVKVSTVILNILCPPLMLLKGYWPIGDGGTICPDSFICIYFAVAWVKV